jgi:hypothetical protein
MRIWIAGLICLSACARAPSVSHALLTQPEKSAIQAKLGDTMRDGPSARWRWPAISDLVLKSGQGYYCGWVNSKNAFGAYSGYEIFEADLTTDSGVRTISDPVLSDGNASILNRCAAVGYDVSAPPPAP